MNILIPNLGTTSLKYQLLSMPDETELRRGRVERVNDYGAAIASIDLGGHGVDAVAFKAVHAGPNYRGTYLVDEGVLTALEEFLPAAPAHNAIYLTGIRAFQAAMPEIPMVAAFETEFHRTMPEYASRYGVPAAWHDERGIRRYGFHGASHQYVSEQTPRILGRDREQLRIISCHLGGSASLCAIRGGRSVDTTMGFSPQSGLENATRHGDLDVYAVFSVMRRRGWSIDEVTAELARNGGLAGLSGIAGGDVRDLEEAAGKGSEAAELALAVFSYGVKKAIGAYAAVMEGVDAIAFTGGIGENSARLREHCTEGLRFLGVRLDRDRNYNGTGDRVVSAYDSAVAVVALATNEELIVARRAFDLLTRV